MSRSNRVAIDSAGTRPRRMVLSRRFGDEVEQMACSGAQRGG
jgi:hypothetical protein